MKIHGFCEIILPLEICLLAAATAFIITGQAVINYGNNDEFGETGAASAETRSTGEDILYRHHEHGHHGKPDAGETDLFDSFADENKSVDQMEGDTTGNLKSSKYTVTANNDEQEHNMPLKHGNFDRKVEALPGSSLGFSVYDGYEKVYETSRYVKETAHSSADGQLSITGEYGIPDDNHYNEIQHKNDVPFGFSGDVSYGSSADALPRFSRDVPPWSSGYVKHGSSGHTLLILPGYFRGDPHGPFADVDGYDEDESIDQTRGDCKDSIESFEAESAGSGRSYGYEGHRQHKLPCNGHHNEASYKGETSLASPSLQGKKEKENTRNGNGGIPGYPPDPPGYLK